MYEYKILKYQATGFWGGEINYAAIEKELNELGNSGWEIISILTTNQAYGQTRDMVVTLKRQR